MPIKSNDDELNSFINNITHNITSAAMDFSALITGVSLTAGLGAAAVGVAAVTTAVMVAVQQLVDDYNAGKIDRNEYNYKWNIIKSKEGPWLELRNKLESRPGKLPTKVEIDPLQACMKKIFDNYYSNISEKESKAKEIKESIKCAYDTIQNLKQKVNAFRSHEPPDARKRKYLSPVQIIGTLEANDWLTIECEIKVFLERLSLENVKKQLHLAKEATAIKRKHPNLEDFLKLLTEEIDRLKKDMDEILKRYRSLTAEQRTEAKKMGEDWTRLKTTREYLKQQIHAFVSKLPKTDKLGGKFKVHALVGEKRIGQFAADLPAAEGSGRGQRRLIYDVIETEGGTYNFELVGITMDHNYNDVPTYREDSGTQNGQ